MRPRLRPLLDALLVLALALIAYAGASLLGPDSAVVMAQPWIGR